jgi:hypothetical protein
MYFDNFGLSAHFNVITYSYRYEMLPGEIQKSLLAGSRCCGPISDFHNNFKTFTSKSFN